MHHELGELLRGKFFQSVLLFPHLLSWVVTAYLVYALLGSTTGFVNNTILDALGKKGVDWYTAKTAWPFILVIVYLWKNAGYNAIVYMAGIAGTVNLCCFDQRIRNLLHELLHQEQSHRKCKRRYDQCGISIYPSKF